MQWKFIFTNEESGNSILEFQINIQPFTSITNKAKPHFQRDREQPFPSSSLQRVWQVNKIMVIQMGSFLVTL